MATHINITSFPNNGTWKAKLRDSIEEATKKSSNELKKYIDNPPIKFSSRYQTSINNDLFVLLKEHSDYTNSDLAISYRHFLWEGREFEDWEHEDPYPEEGIENPLLDKDYSIEVHLNKNLDINEIFLVA